MMNLNELKQKRCKLITDIRELPETQDNYEASLRMDAEIDQLEKQIELLERNENRKVYEDKAIQTASTSHKDTADSDDRAGFIDYLRYGKRSMSGAANADGAYTVPTSIAANITIGSVDPSSIRNFAKVITSATNLDIAYQSSGSTAYWVDETDAVSDSTPQLGKNSFSAWDAKVLIKVSNNLLQDSAANIEAYITQECNYRLSALERTAHITGTGTKQPQGLTVGGTTAVTCASATAITADELIDLYSALTPQYRTQDAVWVMNDSTGKLLRKLKNTTTNEYYFYPAGMTDSPFANLMGHKVIFCSAMPAATSALKSIVFTNMKLGGYTIVDRAGVTVQRLNELYSVNGLTGFLFTLRTDAGVELSEATQVLKMLG